MPSIIDPMELRFWKRLVQFPGRYGRTDLPISSQSTQPYNAEGRDAERPVVNQQP